MEDDLNYLDNGRMSQIFGKWKTTSIFNKPLEEDGDNWYGFYLSWACINSIFVLVLQYFKSFLDWVNFYILCTAGSDCQMEYHHAMKDGNQTKLNQAETELALFPLNPTSPPPESIFWQLILNKHGA